MAQKESSTDRAGPRPDVNLPTQRDDTGRDDTGRDDTGRDDSSASEGSEAGASKPIDVHNPDPERRQKPPDPKKFGMN